MPPWTACTCASSFTLTSTWASSSPTPACPASPLPGPRRTRDFRGFSIVVAQHAAPFRSAQPLGFVGLAFRLPRLRSGRPTDSLILHGSVLHLGVEPSGPA